MKATKLTAKRAVSSIGSQGIEFARVSSGRTTVPGKGVGDGMVVAVEVGTGVKVDVDAGVDVGGMTGGAEVGVVGPEIGAQAARRAVRRTRANDGERLGLFIGVSPS